MHSTLGSRILYCDGNCVIVNKLAGEAVEGAGAGMADLPKLLSALLAGSDWPPAGAAADALPFPLAAHRLDVPVSGCAAFARTREALAALNAAFAANAVEKKYWAIVELQKKRQPLPWLHDGAAHEFVHWMESDPKQNKSSAHEQAGPGRKRAVLRCRLAGKGTNYLFLEIEPQSGRHHQIRAQLHQLGLHVKGDLKYGARRSEKGGGIRLHARLLSFPNPAGGDSRITVTAEPPMMDNLWQAMAACEQ